MAPKDPGSNLLSSQSRNVFTCTGGFPGLCSPRLLCDKITFILLQNLLLLKASPRLLSELFINVSPPLSSICLPLPCLPSLSPYSLYIHKHKHEHEHVHIDVHVHIMQPWERVEEPQEIKKYEKHLLSTQFSQNMRCSISPAEGGLGQTAEPWLCRGDGFFTKEEKAREREAFSKLPHLYPHLSCSQRAVSDVASL